MAHKLEADIYRQDRLQEALIAFLLFGLLTEWVRPLTYISHMTGIYWLEPLLIAIFAFLLLDYIRIFHHSHTMNWLLKLFVCFVIIVHYFDGGSWWEPSAWERYARIWIVDMQHIRQGLWLELSNENRTLMFLLGWAMMIYALYTLLIYRQRAMWFIVSTFIYVSVLHEVGGEGQAAPALLRSAIFGLLLLATMRLPRLTRQYRISDVAIKRWHWGLYSLLLIAALLTTSWLGSILHGQQQSVLAQSEYTQNTKWLQQKWGQWFQQKIESNIAKTGYAQNDLHLGGPLTVDTTVAFTAVTDQLGYWRGEAKSVYTGQGWLEAAGELRQIHEGEFERAEQAGGEVVVQHDTFAQEVTFETLSLGTVLFAGGDIAAIEYIEDWSGIRLPAERVAVDRLAAKASLQQNAIVKKYKLWVHTPETRSIESLNEAELSMYTQLPDSYPATVKALAEHVTQGATSDVEKARMIEAYLATNYRYELKADAPPVGDDFVTHFLFRSKEGYCDHFSSAMVVMLRTLGVPARWAKGFSSGEVTQQELVEGKPRWTVTVRQSDAHSWPEVYIQGEGWTIFEPTPSDADGVVAQGLMQDDTVLNTAMKGEADARIEASSTNAISHHLGPLSILGLRLTDAIKQLDDARLVGLFMIVWQQGNQLWMLHGDQIWMMISAVGMAGLLLLGISVAVVLYRRRRRRELLLQSDALSWLWSHVFRKYGQKKPEQTLREYVSTLSLEEQKAHAMQEWLLFYERSVFGAQPLSRASREKVRQLWRDINH